ADSGETTTTSGSGPSGRTDSTTQSTSRRPSSGCRCFGVVDFMRVPCPAAMTIAARLFFKAGAPGFEPGIAGPKPAALPLGYAPPFGGSLAPVGKQEQERDRSEDAGQQERQPAEDEREDDDDDRERLRGARDPRELAHRVRVGRAPPEEVEREQRERDRDYRPAGDVMEERDDDPLDH